jgi:hypothetical protein
MKDFRLQHLQCCRCVLLQFTESSEGSDLSLVEHSNAIDEIKEGTAERVGDDEHGATDGEILQDGMNHIFAVRIDGGSCFVEDQNRGVSDNRASECDSLSLAT